TAFEEAIEPLRELPVDHSHPDIKLAELGHELLTGAFNMIAFGEVLRDVHELAKAVKWAVFAEMDKVAEEKRDPTPEEWKLHVTDIRPGRRLAASYQAMYFFVRGFQDSVYRALFWLSENPWGPKSSMVNAITRHTEEDVDPGANTVRSRSVGTFVE